MSEMKCKYCFQNEDTDYREGLWVLDKYYICEGCLNADEIFEVMDEMQVEIDRLKKAAPPQKGDSDEVL